MIHSKDRKTVIVTPTKTGTKSLEATLKSVGWDVVMPRHAWQIKECKWAVRTIVLPIRHPYKRLQSMYFFGLATNHSTLLGWGAGGFDLFLANWAREKERRKSPYWTMTYSDYHTSLQQQIQDRTNHFHDCIRFVLPRLEDGHADLLHNCLLLPNVSERHVNKTKLAKPVNTEALWTRSNIKTVEKLLAPDMALGRYTMAQVFK